MQQAVVLLAEREKREMRPLLRRSFDYCTAVEN